MTTQTILSRALAGDRFDDLQIIDCHNHLGPVYNFYNPPAEIEDMLHDADQLGVTRLCVAPHIALFCDCPLGNDQVDEAARRYPERVWAYLTLNSNRPAEIAAQFEQHYGQAHFIGVKLHPSTHKYSASGENYRLVYERLTRQGGFVLIHSWDDCPYANLDLCEQAIRAFPQVPFILAHAGGIPSGVEKSIRAVNTYPNAFLDTSGFEFSHTWIETIVARADNAKILYGSDMPFHDMRGGISRILFADLADEVKTAILGGNFRQMLQMNPRRHGAQG